MSEADIGNFYYDGEGVEVIDDLMRARQSGGGKLRMETCVVVLSYCILLVTAVTGPMPPRQKYVYAATSLAFAVFGVFTVERLAKSSTSMAWAYAGLVGGFTFGVVYKMLRVRKEDVEKYEQYEHFEQDESDGESNKSVVGDDEYPDHSILFKQCDSK